MHKPYVRCDICEYTAVQPNLAPCKGCEKDVPEKDYYIVKGTIKK